MRFVRVGPTEGPDEGGHKAGTVDDLIAYEGGNGRRPDRAFVAMNPGWVAKRDLGNDVYRGGAGFPDLNSPGFGSMRTCG